MLNIDLNNIDETPICSNFPLSKGDLLRYLSKHVIFENCVYTSFATIKSVKNIDNPSSDFLKEFKIAYFFYGMMILKELRHQGESA